MANEYLNNQNFEQVIQSFQTFKRQKARCAFLLKDLAETYERTKKQDVSASKNISLVEQEVKFKDASNQFEEYQQELTQAFYLLSDNLANYYINRYSGVDIDDATQEAVLICFEKIDRFDPRKGRAFNYMTTCIINHFRQIYRSNKNYSELKKKYHTHLQDRYGSVFFRNGRELSGMDFS